MCVLVICMVGLTDKKNFERQAKINDILAVLRQMEAGKIEINTDKFIYEIMLKYGCSERTAKEYIKVATYQLQNAK